MARGARNTRGMGRKKINDEQTPARFPGGTLRRMDALLKNKEKRSDLIRLAVERELRLRERAKVARAKRARPEGGQ